MGFIKIFINIDGAIGKVGNWIRSSNSTDNLWVFNFLQGLDYEKIFYIKYGC